MTKKNLKTAGVMITAIALLIGLSSCGPKKGLVGDPVKGMEITYKLDKDQVLLYKSTTKNVVNMEQMGQAMEMITGAELDYTLTGSGKNEAGNYVSELTIGKFSMTMEGIPGMTAPDLSKIEGAKLTYEFSPNGKKVSLIDTDSLTINMGQMGGGEQLLTTQIQGLLATLPDGMKKIGDTWTVTQVDTTKRNGMDVATDTETKYILVGVEDCNGMECLKITSATTGTLDGTGENQGMSMNLEGDMENNSEIYFAFREQVLVKVITKSFTESTIAISGPMDMTMPMVTDVTATVELIK